MRRQRDQTVLLDEAKKPFNVGAIMRTCDAVGVHSAHACWESAAENAGAEDGAERRQMLHQMRRSLKSASKGSSQWVHLDIHDTLPSAFDAIRAKHQGVQFLVTDVDPAAVDFRAVDFTKPTCLIVGSEGNGVSQASKEAADVLITIPMYGMVESLNVASATAVVLFESQRQRLAAGMYDRQSLTDAEVNESMVMCLCPEVYRWCVRENVRLPIVGEAGDIVDHEWSQLRQQVIANKQAAAAMANQD